VDSARLRDPAWRERFLADLPDNARPLAPAEEALAGQHAGVTHSGS